MKTPRPATVHKGLLFGLLILLLVGGTAVWFFFLRPPAPPEFSAVGGTILVYEVDNPKNEVPLDVILLTQALQKRFDGADLPHVKATPLDKDKVEFRIARWKGKDQDDQEVQKVKDLIARIGRLEFRILANGVDDALGQEAAIQMIEGAKDLEERALKGLPPPPPTRQGDPELPSVFEVTLAKGMKSRVSYAWMEIGPQEMQSLNLDHEAEKDPRRKEAWLEARTRLNHAVQLPNPHVPRWKRLNGALFFGRVCRDQSLPEAERQRRKYEFFVLTRDPEFDPVDPANSRRLPRMDGSFLSKVYLNEGWNGEPAVWFKWNSPGSELFGSLTRKNLPEGVGLEGEHKRHLGIFLDGLLVSAPVINSEIRDGGVINGNFTKKEVENLIALLRNGALPGKLKPLPISETTVEPGQKK